MDELLSQLARETPVVRQAFEVAPDGPKTGLVIVDEVKGFAAVGGGNLAPPVENAQVSRMIEETDRLARAFSANRWPILAFLDTHEPGKPEPPYPPHCEIGSGEEELVDELTWLESDPNTTLVRKDCINGFIGAFDVHGRNAVVDWVDGNAVEELLVVGICTDICVMDFVLTALSARNHGMMGNCREIIVYDGACATYDLPRDIAASLDLPEDAAHPQDVTHHMGLYFMASRGARIAHAVSVRGD